MCVITFKPIEVPTHSTSQNDCLNLSFVKDKDTYGKKMARKGRTQVIYKGTFISDHSLVGDNLPSPVGIVLIDLPNIGGGGSGPPMATWFRHHSSNGPYPPDQYLGWDFLLPFLTANRL